MRSIDSILADLQPFDDSKRFELTHATYLSTVNPWRCELAITSEGSDRITLNGKGKTAAEAVNEVFVKYEKLFRLPEVRQSFCPPSIEYHSGVDLGDHHSDMTPHRPLSR